MANAHTFEEQRPETLRERNRRSANLSTMLTADESKKIKDAASQVSKTPSEWAREVLLRSANPGSYSEMEVHLFTELVGVQMLLMNALEPLLRGDKMTQEQLTGSSDESRQPRSCKRKNSSPSAVATGKND